MQKNAQTYLKFAKSTQSDYGMTEAMEQQLTYSEKLIDDPGDLKVSCTFQICTGVQKQAQKTNSMVDPVPEESALYNTSR